MPMTRKEFWDRHHAIHGETKAINTELSLALHREYYSQYALMVQVEHYIPLALVDKCKEALAAGDYWFNSPYTRLKDWYDLGYLTKVPAIAELRRINGESWSESFNTCVLKEAVRLYLERDQPS